MVTIVNNTSKSSTTTSQPANTHYVAGKGYVSNTPAPTYYPKDSSGKTYPTTNPNWTPEGGSSTTDARSAQIANIRAGNVPGVSIVGNTIVSSGGSANVQKVGVRGSTVYSTSTGQILNSTPTTLNAGSDGRLQTVTITKTPATVISGPAPGYVNPYLPTYDQLTPMQKFSYQANNFNWFQGANLVLTKSSDYLAAKTQPIWSKITPTSWNRPATQGEINTFRGIQSGISTSLVLGAFNPLLTTGASANMKVTPSSETLDMIKLPKPDIKFQANVKQQGEYTKVDLVSAPKNTNFADLKNANQFQLSSQTLKTGQSGDTFALEKGYNFQKIDSGYKVTGYQGIGKITDTKGYVVQPIKGFTVKTPGTTSTYTESMAQSFGTITLKGNKLVSSSVEITNFNPQTVIGVYNPAANIQVGFTNTGNLLGGSAIKISQPLDGSFIFKGGQPSALRIYKSGGSSLTAPTNIKGVITIKPTQTFDSGSGTFTLQQPKYVSPIVKQSIESQLSKSVTAFTPPPTNLQIGTSMLSTNVNLLTQKTFVMPKLDTSTTQLVTPQSTTQTFTLQQPKYNTKQEVIVTTAVVPKLKLNIGTTSITATTPVTTAITIPSTTTRTGMGFPPMDFFPTNVPIPLFMPNLSGMSGFMSSRKVGAKGRRKYTPSFDALLKGIKGKAPKSGAVTALGTRPKTKGFMWEFSRSKLFGRWF